MTQSGREIAKVVQPMLRMRVWISIDVYSSADINDIYIGLYVSMLSVIHLMISRRNQHPNRVHNMTNTHGVVVQSLLNTCKRLV